LDANQHNLDALQIQACVHRLQGNTSGADSAIANLLALDPLNHFAHFEQYLQRKTQPGEFTSLIRTELPHEIYLELAAWYRSAGLDEDAAKVLDLAPASAEVLYWLAYLRQDKALLARAEAASPAFVFPFRTESVSVLEWAMQTPAWEPKYYLALLRWSQGEIEQARELLANCGDVSKFAPLYAARAQVSPETAVRDLEKAARLDSAQWRYGAMLARLQLKQGNPVAALAAADEYTKRFPTNGALALLHAKALLASNRHEQASDLLSSLKLLPCEGNTEAHALFRESHLMLAVLRLKAGAFDEALHLIDKAREWPESLGAGKPYPSDSDERLEEWLAYQCYLKRNASSEAQQMLNRIISFPSPPGDHGVGEVVHALALKQSSRVSEAEELLNDWLKAEPSNQVAKWGKELLTGGRAPLPQELQDGGCRILAASL